MDLQAAKALVKEANRRWNSSGHGGSVDDCTAIVIYMEPVLAKDKPSLGSYISSNPLSSAVAKGFQWATGR